MRYNKLGRTGLFVSELCLGTMTFGGSEGLWQHMGGLQQADAERLVGKAIDAGINFIDTADVYAEGQSEEITGRALKNLKIPRENIVVATKVFGQTGSGPNQRGSSRAHIMDGIKASLRRLQLDHIDLYQIHGFDPATPIDETLHALDLLVRQGRVRYVGVSNWAAWHITKARGISEGRGLVSFDAVQAYYSIAGRDLERELAPMIASEELGLLVWSPLAGGLLSGKYQTPQTGTESVRRQGFDFPPVDHDRANQCIALMRPMAEKRGVSIAQIAIAWLLHRKVVTSVIIGAKRIEQLDDNIAATKIDLAAEEMDKLDSVSALPQEYPQWMLEFMTSNDQLRLGNHQRLTAR